MTKWRDETTPTIRVQGLEKSFNAAERYDVSGAQILLEAGRRKLIGGQEDQLIDIALMLKEKADANA